MPKLTDWRWWAGNVDSVDDDGVFDLAEGATRDEVVQAACRELSVGEAFYIIEARCWDGKTEPVDGVQKFARFKNRECLIAGPHLAQVASR